MLVKSQGQKLRVQVDGARADVYESDLVFHLSTELDSGRTERWREWQESSNLRGENGHP